ncbi:MAG TPA: NAD-dependent epimerase/dehydratase family protein [Chloroflexota bacterium]
MDDVFLTGATGFVGSHVLAALLEAGFRVRALVRPDSRPLPVHPACRPVQGDVRRSGELTRQMSGCRYLIHVAALYSFSPRRRRDLYETNVSGCAGLLEAARLAGIERAVVTSSSATVGPARGDRPATEDDWADEADAASGYHATKLWQERAALAAQLPTVILLPTAPVGPDDWKPTPTGKMIQDFLRGRIFASLDSGLNVVAVEDVAQAHLLALHQGRPGERYIIGGENLALGQLWEILARICGRSTPKWRIPYALALTLAHLDEQRCRVIDAAPVIPLEGVHMARHHMFASCEKARAELGYEATPVSEALSRAVQWYRENGAAA